MHISQGLNNVLKVLDTLVCATISLKNYIHEQKQKSFVLILLQTQITHPYYCRSSNAFIKGKEEMKPLTGGGCVNYTRRGVLPWFYPAQKPWNLSETGCSEPGLHQLSHTPINLNE